MSSDEFIDVYRRYLNRFDERFGEVDFSESVQHEGKLIQKLRYDEFAVKWGEYKKIEEFLLKS